MCGLLYAKLFRNVLAAFDVFNLRILWLLVILGLLCSLPSDILGYGEVDLLLDPIVSVFSYSEWFARLGLESATFLKGCKHSGKV